MKTQLNSEKWIKLVLFDARTRLSSVNPWDPWQKKRQLTVVRIGSNRMSGKRPVKNSAFLQNLDLKWSCMNNL